MLKVGIIGCGKVGDEHAMLLQYLPDVEITATCDREELMARQLKERIGARYFFSDVNDMLHKTDLDVVHITTPPQSHFGLGRTCLEAGCHLFVEKPFTVDAQEALMLLDLAEEWGLKVTVGHNNQFSPVARTMRDLVKDGALGGPPVHIESIFGYDMGDTTRGYAKALLGDKNHWVRSLPGKLLHNVISHGISKIAEFMPVDTPDVTARGFPSPLLRGMGADDIMDELRVIVTDNERTTAYFTFSSSMKPCLQQMTLYGPAHSMLVDYTQNAILRIGSKNYKSYLRNVFPLANYSGQYFKNMLSNLWLFMTNRLHVDSGRRYLVANLYRSIREDGPPPIPYREIILTAYIMDEIFKQCCTEKVLTAGMDPIRVGGLGREPSRSHSDVEQTNPFGALDCNSVHIVSKNA
jgi:predicted dehydrogenase